MNAKQIKKYLERIGITEDAQISEEWLQKMIFQNLTHVPFENLDTIEKGIAPSLEDEDIYRKVVEERRGGWCFELNKVFMRLLQSIGYEAYPVAVRIIWMRPALTAPTHRATIVTMGDQFYYVDIGYGGPGPKGLVVLKEGVQVIGGVKFNVVNLHGNVWQIEREYEDVFSPMLHFELKEIPEIDFNLPNFYCAKNENVIFSGRIVCNLMTEDGNIGFNDKVLTIKKGDEVTTTEYQTKDEILSVLKQYFGLEL